MVLICLKSAKSSRRRSKKALPIFILSPACGEMPHRRQGAEPHGEKSSRGKTANTTQMPCGRPFHGSNASASLIWRRRFRAEREPESICSASRGAVSAAIRIFGGYHPGDRGAEFAAGRFRIRSTAAASFLVTGETGSGKSHDVGGDFKPHQPYAVQPHHHAGRPDRVHLRADQCIINQREIGKDTRSYADGLRSILREDRTLSLIGEMRDLNTIETALTAAGNAATWSSPPCTQTPRRIPLTAW